MQALVVQGTFSVVRNSRGPSNHKSHVRPNMCIHVASSAAEGAIQVVHAVEETVPRNRRTHTPASLSYHARRKTGIPLAKKKPKRDCTRAAKDTWKASSWVGCPLMWTRKTRDVARSLKRLRILQQLSKTPHTRSQLKAMMPHVAMAFPLVPPS